MNWNISAWSIRRPVPSIILFIILTILGVGSFVGLGIDETPNIDDPIVNVTVSEVGAAPSELETQVTRRVEDAVAGLGHIKHITSTVTEGASSTIIEFELGTDTDRAVNDVRDAVTRIRTQLPSGINGDPIVQRVDFVGGAFATYSVVSPHRSVAEVSWLIDNDISRALMGVKGVGQVQRNGGVDREIHVDLDPTRLEPLGLTADGVNNQIRDLNINMPGGRMDLAGGEQSVRTLGSSATVETLKAMRLALPDGGWARLDTVGKVMDTESEPRQEAILNGQSVVAFSIVRSNGSNMVDVEKAVDGKLAELRHTLPSDVIVQKIRTNAIFVLESYYASFDALIIGALLAVLVIWLFLRDTKAAVISALAMPLSVIPTFAIMKWANFTLNNMSLLGLSLVIGILVDDAIVEIENIVRHINMGKKPYQAALEAADEIGLAVVATTFAIMVVFLPVAFMGGIPGQFFKQFGLTVAVAVFFSLLVARLITPMMAAYWMRAPKHEAGRSALMPLYNRLLGWSLRHRLVTVVAGVGFFILSIVLFSRMPTDLFSHEDRSQTAVNIALPPDASLAETSAVTRRIVRLLHQEPEVQSTFAEIGIPVSKGFGSTSSASVSGATIFVTLVPRGQRQASQLEFETRMRPLIQWIPGARVTFSAAEGGPSGQLQILLASDHPEDLEQSAQAVLRDMRRMPSLADVQSSSSLSRPEILVVPDTALAAEQNVSIQSIARTASIATLGDIDQNLAKFDLPNRQINIRVEIDPRYRNNLDLLRSLKVMGGSGRLVPLDTVAQVKVGSGPSEIDHYDRQRQVTITASMNAGATLGESVNAVHNLPSFRALPTTVHELPSGDVEIQHDVFTGFAEAMGAAVLFIFAVLALLFGEFLQPLTIMVSLPLSLGGALMALLADHQPIGFYALIGIIMLMGLVTKNAILLVEYCLMAMHQGQSRQEAILAAGEARMRPILMTTVAMIAGMIPIAIGVGAGSEERAPMALAVIGGLITSTFLTLLLVPVVFTLMDDVKQFLYRWRPRPEGEAVLTEVHA